MASTAFLFICGAYFIIAIVAAIAVVGLSEDILFVDTLSAVAHEVIQQVVHLQVELEVVVALNTDTILTLLSLVRAVAIFVVIFVAIRFTATFLATAFGLATLLNALLLF